MYAYQPRNGETTSTPTTIATDVASTWIFDWGVQRAFTEIVQNYIDGLSSAFNIEPAHIYVVKTAEAFTTTYTASSRCTVALGTLGHIRVGRDTIQLLNRGVKLERHVLYFGCSGKRTNNLCQCNITVDNPTNPIGSHGDGFLRGILPLLRSGAEINIHTNGELWGFFFTQHPLYSSPVVACRVTALEPSSPYHTDTLMTIRNIISSEIFCPADFLLLRPSNVISVPPIGELIRSDPDTIFFRGIRVHTLDISLYYGINFIGPDVQLDMDRGIVGLQQHIVRLWASAIKKYTHLADEFLEMCIEFPDSLEVVSAKMYNEYMDDDVVRVIRERYESEDYDSDENINSILRLSG